MPGCLAEIRRAKAFHQVLVRGRGGRQGQMGWVGWGRGVATRLQVSLFTTLYLSFGVEEQGSPSHQDKDFMAV